MNSDFRNNLSKISFISHNVSSGLSGKKALKDFIKALFIRENRELEHLTYIFCTDALLKGINKEFLQHDYYTDILTFLLSERPGPVTSEIYISIPRVRENAKVFKSSYLKELHRVIIHGALHLCGYDDHTERERTQMRKKEDQYLKLLGFT